MKLHSQKDLGAGLLFLLTGLAFAIGSTQYSFGASARPGPGFFPFGLGVLTALFGAAIAIKALMVPTDGSARIGPIAWKPLLVIVGSLVLFGVLLPNFGLAVALPLLIFCSAMAGDEFKVKEAVASAALITVGSWAIFIKGLKLSIPLWPSFIG